MTRQLRADLREESLPRLPDEHLTCFDSVLGFFELMERFRGNKEAAINALNNLCNTVNATHFHLVKHWVETLKAETERLRMERAMLQAVPEGQEPETEDATGGFEGTRVMADGRKVTRVSRGELPEPQPGRRFVKLSPSDPHYPTVEVEVMPGETDEEAMARASEEFNRLCQEMMTGSTEEKFVDIPVEEKTKQQEELDSTMDRLFSANSNLPSSGPPRVPDNTPVDSNDLNATDVSLAVEPTVLGTEACHATALAQTTSDSFVDSHDMLLAPSVFPPAPLSTSSNPESNEPVFAVKQVIRRRPRSHKKKGAFWC